MYAERELSIDAIRAHSRLSSAHARHSAAVVIFISTSEPRERKHSLGVILKHLFVAGEIDSLIAAMRRTS
jgi:hypothetical protein